MVILRYNASNIKKPSLIAILGEFISGNIISIVVKFINKF